MGWKYLSGSFGTISQISQTGSVETMQLIDNLHCTRYFYLDWAFTILQTRSDAECPSVCFKKFHPKVRNHESSPTRAFSWLKAAATAFTFKTLLKDTMLNRR